MFDSTELELAGSVMVDSGQIMIGDPCYLEDWIPQDMKTWDEDMKNNPKRFDYNSASAASCSSDKYGELDKGTAFVVATAWGDGKYPVYVLRDVEGRISGVFVDFDNIFMNDEDEDDD